MDGWMDGWLGGTMQNDSLHPFSNTSMLRETMVFHLVDGSNGMEWNGMEWNGMEWPTFKVKHSNTVCRAIEIEPSKKPTDPSNHGTDRLPQSLLVFL